MSPEDSKDKSITDVHFMDQNYNWSKLEQSMMSGRMGHASIYDGTDSRCLFTSQKWHASFYRLVRYTEVPAIAQKVFEGDVVFSILIDRGKNDQ